MTQKELAQKAGVTESALLYYIKGDRIPRAVNLVKIANALGISTDFLLDQSGGNGRKAEIVGVMNEVAISEKEMRLLMNL